MPRDGDGVFTLQHDLVADKEAIPPVPPSAERFQEILDDIAAQINDLEPASDITAQLAGKANVADVDAALELKVDSADLASESDTSLGAALVGFKSTASGAVGRLLQDKLADYVDAADFGASPAASAATNYAAITAALTASEIVHLGPGTFNFSSQIVMPSGRSLIGSGEGVTILQADNYSHNGVIASAVSNVTVRDMSILGVYNAAGTTGGLVVDNSSYCTFDNLTISGWSAQGFAYRLATYCKAGKITSINNGHRGFNISAFSHHNTFGQLIATGNYLAAVNINYGCYDNTFGQVIGGGHRNAGFWFSSDVYRNTVGEIIMEPPETGYEDNAAVVLGWHAYRNSVNRVTARGWRRGLQFKADTISLTGDSSIDSFVTNGNTEENSVTSLWFEADTTTGAAAIYMDSAASRIVKKNKVLSIHAKSCQYGVWDTTGDSDQNDFVEQTLDTVTTPWSLPALGTNKGFFRTSADYLGLDCQDPAGPWHVRRPILGDHLSIAENSLATATTNKAVGFQGRHRDTSATQKIGATFKSIPLDNDAVNIRAGIFVSNAGVLTEYFKVHADGPSEVAGFATGSIPAGTSGRIVMDTTTTFLKYHDGTSWRSIPKLEADNTFTGVGNVFTSTLTVQHAAEMPQLIYKRTDTATNSLSYAFRFTAQGTDASGTLGSQARFEGQYINAKNGAARTEWRFSSIYGGTLSPRIYVGQSIYSASLFAKSATVTISNASPGVVTWNSHGLSNGDPVAFATTGGLPSPLATGSMNNGVSSGTVYYVANKTSNTFELAATPAGASINTTTAGSGTHTGYAPGGDTGAGTINMATAYYVSGTQVLGARDTGWSAMTGSANKATVYDTSTVTLAQLAGRVMSLQAALTTHGVIGA